MSTSTSTTTRQSALHPTGEFAARPRLLIVEDDAALLVIWQIVFARRGWEVAVASTVAEGLASLDPPPDFLILDLLLPDQRGEVVLRRVREAGLKTRVAVTTASDDAGQLSTIGDLDPEALFLKPFSIADVWREGEAARAG
jgi:DNA-binding response OmpR family regulator